MTKLTPHQLEIIKHPARVWYAAEFGPTDDGDPPFDDIPRTIADGDVLSVGVPRAMRVFNGEVRYSEASRGDRAIWGMQPRHIEAWLSGNPVRESQWLWMAKTWSAPPVIVQFNQTFGCGNAASINCGGGIPDGINTFVD